jgi:hypothetical protein
MIQMSMHPSRLKQLEDAVGKEEAAEELEVDHEKEAEKTMPKGQLYKVAQISDKEKAAERLQKAWLR